jgi:hypothetical protein
MRDLTKNPYSTDEQRVVKFLAEAQDDDGIGGGDDPIGLMLVSWRGAVLLADTQAAEIAKLRAAMRVNALRWGYTHAQIDELLSNLSTESLDESRRA